jgi:hypothetical protein
LFIFTGGIKMRYPSKYVLVTVIDDLVNNNNNNVNNFNNLNSTKQNNLNTSSNDNLLNNKENCTLIAPLTLPETPVNDLGHPLSMTIEQSTSTILPERVWQDCVQNPSFTNGAKHNGNNNNLLDMNNENISSIANNQNESSTLGGGGGDVWESVDPHLKANCVCAK